MADFAAFISLQDLGYPKPSIRDAITIAKATNKRSGIAVLAQLNVQLCLAQFTHDLKTVSDTQARLISQIVSERRQRELADKLSAEPVHERPLVHRAQLLVAMKLIGIFGTPAGGNMLERRDDFDLIGELALIINSLFDFDSFGAIRDDYGLATEVAQQMGPLFELNNPEAPGNGMVRIREMLGQILEEHKWRKPLRYGQALPNMADQLERVFVFTTGLGFEAYRDMTFAVYAYYMGNRSGILDGSAPITFNPSDSNAIVTWNSIKGFLEQSSFSLCDLIDSLDSPDVGNRFLLDYTFFRKRPIFKLDEERYICLDPGLLLEKLTSGFFWSVMNALGEGGTDEDRERTLSFSRLWGSLFEEYVIRRLRDAYGDGPCSPLLVRPQYNDGNEAFDAAIDFGESLVVVQIKGLFVPVWAKSAGVADVFMSGIDDKFGLQPGAALEQHLRNIQLAFNRDSRNRRPIQGLDVSAKRAVFPLVVTQERLLRLGLIAKILSDDFMTKLASLPLRSGVQVQRPIFLTVDEYESLVPYLLAGDMTFLDVLNAKLHQDKNGLLSFWETFSDYYLKKKKLAHRENLLLKEQWEELRSESLERFRLGFYSNLGTR